VIFFLFLGVLSVGQNADQLKDTRYLMNLVREYKNEGKIDSSYYYLDIAKKRIFENKSKDSILLYYSWNIELARFDYRRYLSDQATIAAETYFNEVSPYKFDKDILAFYLNRRLAVFMQYHYTNNDTLQLSLNTANKILELRDSVRNKSIIAYTLNEKAQIFDYYIDKSKGLELYREALNYANSNNLTEAAIDISINLARYHDVKNDPTTAIEILENAFELAQSKNLLWQSMTLCKLLYINHKRVGNFERALNYKELHFEKYEVYLRQNNLQLVQDAQNELRLNNQNNELKNSRNTLILVSVFLVIMLILLVLVWFSRNKVKQNNQALEALSEENLFLVSEANHRINNNLQMIIILITDQLKDQSQREKEYLKSILSKIESISSLHSHLYKKEDKSTINIEDYLNEVIHNFEDTFLEKGIQVKFKTDKINLPINFATYLGLLITELCLNSIKHAFNNQKNKEIAIECKVMQKTLYFNFTDNGALCDENNLKPELVLKMCRQLKVSPVISCRNGFYFNFQKQL
jgi:two-component sensor histidine kinase